MSHCVHTLGAIPKSNVSFKPIFHCDAKPFASGPRIGVDPQRKISRWKCWYLKTLEFALAPMRILKVALPPTRKPNPSQWNIGCVGSQTQNFRVGHVHFMLSLLMSFAFVMEYGL